MIKKCTIKLVPWIMSIVFFGTSLSHGAVNPSEAERYIIRQKDVLDIEIYPQKELNTKVEVDDNGDIFFAFLGNIKAEGYAANEFAEYLRVVLEKDYLINPSVVVRVIKAKTEEVAILGQVNKPGTYPYDHADKLTLVRLVSLAGGFTNVANMNGTKIVRAQKDGEDRTINVKVGRILEGKEDDVELEPDDIVIVPESFF